jgi:hypothetical protein
MKLFTFFRIMMVALFVELSINLLEAQSIELGNVAAELGDTVLVPINFTSMQNIGAITLFIIYDPSSLEFAGITNIVSEAQGILANGGFQPLINNTAIGIVWSANTAGVNFPNGKFLDLKLVFTNTNSSLNFYTNYCEIADWDANILSVTYQNGGIYINQGATYSEWNGNGNWTDESFWSNGVPGAITKARVQTGTVNIFSSAVCQKLIVSGGAGLIIQPQNSLTVFDSILVSGNFTIKSDVTGTGSFINQGEIVVTGTTNAERYISSSEHLISSPVSNAPASTFSGLTVKKYNEPTQTWIALSQNDPLEITKGYHIKADVDAVYNFEGIFNSGDFMVSGLSNTTSAGAEYPIGMNLIGNPYPSAISWNTGAWVKNNIHGSVYGWDGVQYISWNGEIGGLKNGTVPSGQGFIVFTANSLAELKIPNNSRIHSNQPFYKNEEEKISNMIEIAVSGGEYGDKTYLQFKYGTSSSFDLNHDAYKLRGIEQAPAVYTFTYDQIRSSINVLPDVNIAIDTAIRIGFSAPEPGEYQFHFNGNTFSGVYDLYLKDSELDSLQRLSVDSVYGFYAQQGIFDDRFSLYFKKPSAIRDMDERNVNIYVQNGFIRIGLSQSQSMSISLYDLQGRLVKMETFQNTSELTVPIGNLTRGIYLLNLRYESGLYYRKLFIK